MHKVYDWKRYGKPLIFFCIMAGVAWADRVFGWSAVLSDPDLPESLLAAVRGDLPRALLLYTLLTIVGCVVLALPGVTFAVAAGLLFGPWLGTLACLLATTVGAIASFLVGRFFLRDSIRPLAMKNKWLKKVLFEDAGRSDIVVLMITRLVPVFPYNLQNFAYGITDISLTAYAFCTFLFMLPGVAMFTIGAAGFTAEDNRWMYFAGAAVLMAAVFALGRFLKKKYLNVQAPEREPERSARR